MDVLIRVFRHAGADDREILFGVRTGGARVDECVGARFEVAIADDAVFKGGEAPLLRAIVPVDPQNQNATPRHTTILQFCAFAVNAQSIRAGGKRYGDLAQTRCDG